MPKSRKKSTQTRPRFARSGAGEISGSQHAHIEERAKNLRSLDHAIRRVVLLRAAIGVQPDCRSALQDQSRTETQRLICASRPFEELRTRRRTPGC